MTIESLREAYRRQPFRPFVMHLADGRTIPVPSPEFMAAAPTGRTVIVFGEGESFNIIDLLLVTDLEFRDLPPAKGRKRPTA